MSYFGYFWGSADSLDTNGEIDASNDTCENGPSLNSLNIQALSLSPTSAWLPQSPLMRFPDLGPDAVIPSAVEEAQVYARVLSKQYVDRQLKLDPGYVSPSNSLHSCNIDPATAEEPLQRSTNCTNCPYPLSHISSVILSPTLQIDTRGMEYVEEESVFENSMLKAYIQNYGSIASKFRQQVHLDNSHLLQNINETEDIITICYREVPPHYFRQFFDLGKEFFLSKLNSAPFIRDRDQEFDDMQDKEQYMAEQNRLLYLNELIDLGQQTQIETKTPAILQELTNIQNLKEKIDGQNQQVKNTKKEMTKQTKKGHNQVLSTLAFTRAQKRMSSVEQLLQRVDHVKQGCLVMEEIFLPQQMLLQEQMKIFPENVDNYPEFVHSSVNTVLPIMQGLYTLSLRLCFEQEGQILALKHKKQELVHVLNIMVDILSRLVVISLMTRDEQFDVILELCRLCNIHLNFGKEWFRHIALECYENVFAYQQEDTSADIVDIVSTLLRDITDRTSFQQNSKCIPESCLPLFSLPDCVFELNKDFFKQPPKNKTVYSYPGEVKQVLDRKRNIQQSVKYIRDCLHDNIAVSPFVYSGDSSVEEDQCLDMFVETLYFVGDKIAVGEFTEQFDELFHMKVKDYIVFHTQMQSCVGNIEATHIPSLYSMIQNHQKQFLGYSSKDIIQTTVQLLDAETWVCGVIDTDTQQCIDTMYHTISIDEALCNSPSTNRVRNNNSNGNHLSYLYLSQQRTLYVCNDNTLPDYLVLPSIANIVIKHIHDYLALAKITTSAPQLVAVKLHEFLNLVNSRIQQLILGAGMLQFHKGTINSISATHLCLAAQFAVLLYSQIHPIRLLLQNIIPLAHYSCLTAYTVLEKDITEHEVKILNKLASILGAACKNACLQLLSLSWAVESTVFMPLTPSSNNQVAYNIHANNNTNNTNNNNDIVVDNAILQFTKQTQTLISILDKYLSKQQTTSILSEVEALCVGQIFKYQARLNMNNTLIMKHMHVNMLYLTEKLKTATNNTSYCNQLQVFILDPTHPLAIELDKKNSSNISTVTTLLSAPNSTTIPEEE